MILTLEIIGTIAFAVSGAMVAIGKKMDIFGVIMLGVTTAVGGGVIRDVILDTTPPLVFQNPVYALTGAVVSLLVFLPFIRRKINVDGLILQVMDSIGLAIFVVVGIRYSISFENRFLSVFVGVLTGVGGGVMRDIFAGDRPMIFVRHFYACAAILGALLCIFLWEIDENLAMISGAALIFVIRILAARFRWHLPKA
ncbi:MAG: TRIC cation channel family protein [Lachnospiraceae bacterium]|nr:TRIC cation channel family protein [Lachnospiraceae bacterium]MBR0086274.1 TRIC cation channel family protein [Lachnospiraceae bacterium]